MELVEVKKQPIKYKTNAGDEIDITTDCFTIMTPPKTADIAVKRMQGRVKIPGFRPGKAPRKVIETQIGKENLYMDYLSEAWAEFIATNNVLLATTNEIGNVHVCLDGSISFSVVTTTIDPVALTLKEQYEVDVTKSVMNKVAQKMQNLRNKYTTIETATEADRTLQWGEIAKFSFKGYSEGSETPDEDLCGTDNVIMVGNHSIVIPEIEEALVEMKVNDTRTITCKLSDDLAEKLPKNPRAKLVAGKAVRFEITLHEIQVRKFPTDEEIATKEGKESYKNLYLAHVNEEVVEAEKHPKESMEELLKQIITDNETVLSSVVTPVVLDHRLNTFLTRYQTQLVGMEEAARQKVVQDSVERITKSVYQDITINSLAHQFAEQIGDATDEEVKAYMEVAKSQGLSYWQAYQQVQHTKLMDMMAERCQPKFDTENETFKAVVDAIPATTKPIDEIVTEVAEAASTKDNA